MDRQDWTLLAIGFGGGRGLSPVQLQKSLFLLRMEVPEVGAGFYDFTPYNYGPFCKQIYVDAEMLAEHGFVAIVPESSYPTFLITQQGQAKLTAMRDIPRRAHDYLEQAVLWTQRQSFSGLVRAIYEKYPAYQANSVFQY